MPVACSIWDPEVADHVLGHLLPPVLQQMHSEFQVLRDLLEMVVFLQEVPAFAPACPE